MLINFSGYTYDDEPKSSLSPDLSRFISHVDPRYATLDRELSMAALNDNGRREELEREGC